MHIRAVASIYFLLHSTYALSSCTPPAGGSPSKDDSQAIATSIKQCGIGGTIVIPKGSMYYINEQLDFSGCKGCTFQIDGTLKASGSTKSWESKRCILNIKEVAGLKMTSPAGSGVIDRSGQEAYERFAKDTSLRRPTLACISGGSNVELSHFRLMNPPNVFIHIGEGTAVASISDMTLEAKSSSGVSPKNTDGIAIGKSTHVTVTNTRISNQDDCVTFKPGASLVTVDRVTCSGSHGMSVGSLGKNGDDTVTNVVVKNAHMIRSTKAAGIKTYPPCNGHGVSTVSNVTFTGFKVEDCEYAIQIQSSYGDKESCPSRSGGAKLNGIIFEDFSGTTNKKFDPVTGNLNCGKGGSCDVRVSKYMVKTPSGSTKVLCENTPKGLGLNCSPGAFG